MHARGPTRVRGRAARTSRTARTATCADRRRRSRRVRCRRTVPGRWGRTAPRRRMPRRRGATARAPRRRSARPARSSTMPAFVVPAVAAIAHTESGSGSAARARSSAAPVSRSASSDSTTSASQSRIRKRARDRRMRLLADRDPPAVGATTAARRRRLPGDHERRQVSGRTTRDEASARGRREPGEVGEEPQRLVLGVDRARRLQPRRRVDRRRRDDRVEHERGLGRRGRDEREEPRAVGRDARGREHLGEHPEHGFGVTALGRDRPPRTRRELVVGAGVVERRGVEPEPLERVVEARPRRALGCLVEVVHGTPSSERDAPAARGWPPRSAVPSPARFRRYRGARRAIRAAPSRSP